MEWEVLHDWKPGDRFVVPGPQGWTGEVLRSNAWQFLVKVEEVQAKPFLMDDWQMEYMTFVPVDLLTPPWEG